MLKTYHLCWSLFVISGDCLRPHFVRPLENITVPEGKDATFTCTVDNLGGHKVAWIKADTKAILAIHTVVITHLTRLDVKHELNTWTLTLKQVKRSDSGPYMCQVNTDPMHYQVGLLEVVVPPDIMTSHTSGDVIVPEGGSARLQCKAEGFPTPRITWQREDGQEILLRNPRKMKVAMFNGQVLNLQGITRSEMGVYLCIANNGIPPPVSKRTMISVNFPPMVDSVTSSVTVSRGVTVALSCVAEASPKPIFYWRRHNDEMILTGSRHVSTSFQHSLYRYNISLTILAVTARDFGTYHCVAKNSVGVAESTVTVFELKSELEEDDIFSSYTEPTYMLTGEDEKMPSPHTEVYFPPSKNRENPPLHPNKKRSQRKNSAFSLETSPIINCILNCFHLFMFISSCSFNF